MRLLIDGATPICAGCGRQYGDQVREEEKWWQLRVCRICGQETLCIKAAEFKWLPRLPTEIAAKIMREDLSQ